MKKLKLMPLLAYIAIALGTLSGCGDPLESKPIITLISVEQVGGVNQTANTTGLRFTYDKDPQGLKATDFTVTRATKGALTGSGKSRVLELTEITADNGQFISVSINPSSLTNVDIGSGYFEVKVFKYLHPITLLNVSEVGGVSGVTDTQSLLLTFSEDPDTLSKYDISLTGARVDQLSGSGTTRSITLKDVRFLNGESITVTLRDPDGYVIMDAEKQTVVYRGFHIGMPYQGGYVAYILKPGDPGYVSVTEHKGIIVAESDLGTMQWAPKNDFLFNKTERGLLSGLTNTTELYDYYKHLVQPWQKMAFKEALSYTNPDRGTGVYEDWFLPSIEDLTAMAENIEYLDCIDQDRIYWSSTNEDQFKAMVYTFDVAMDFGSFKSFYQYVLPVRYF
jgi:hypothetical protein